MHLNQIPTQFVEGEVTALETRLAEQQAVDVMPEEPRPTPVANFFANIPQPMIWLGAMVLGLMLLGGRRRT